EQGKLGQNYRKTMLCPQKDNQIPFPSGTSGKIDVFFNSLLAATRRAYTARIKSLVIAGIAMAFSSLPDTAISIALHFLMSMREDNTTFICCKLPAFNVDHPPTALWPTYSMTSVNWIALSQGAATTFGLS
ncbi:hypothetical protein, partial [Thiolapillus sp.]|uniref:hypothetical protein n=6 Tax=Thiolapillus sp. TaxID=2017437 RepID=UPI003AF52422